MRPMGRWIHVQARWGGLMNRETCGCHKSILSLLPVKHAPHNQPQVVDSLLVGGNGVSGTTAIAAIGATSLNLANH